MGTIHAPLMLDSWLPESQDRLPLTWWRQHPVYLAAVIALAGVASMILTAVLGYDLMRHFVFSFEEAFGNLRLWTPLTYVLFNPPSLWTLIGCFLLWSFGEAVERHLGRRAFVRLLLLLLLASPLMITALGLAGVGGLVCAGILQLEFGVFIAFATLYPRAKISLILITLEAWVLAAIFVGINALGHLAARDWTSLLLLATNVGAAHAFIRFEKGEISLPSLPKTAPKSVKKTRSVKTEKKAASTPGVDDILDKISREGMHSLTAEERRILDAASEEMKRRSGR